jgi:hypothetical protein
VLSCYRLDSLPKDVRGVKLNSREVDLEKALSVAQPRLATSSKVAPARGS